MDISLFFQGLILLGSLGFLVVVYYAFRLSKETKNEKYWLVLAISAIFLAIHQWTMIPWELHVITNDVRFVIQQISVIIGAVLFAYAIYGLFTSMKRIREKMG
jgi:uncharacterized membrane-anchored protein